MTDLINPSEVIMETRKVAAAGRLFCGSPSMGTLVDEGILKKEYVASASWGGSGAQAAASLPPRTVLSIPNFLCSCFLHTFSTFRIFRFLRVIASISLVSWRREPFASRRAVNKQKSQAEILENYQALPLCFRVSWRQRMRR